MKSPRITLALALIFSLAITGAAFGQARLTGTITGQAKLDDGNPVPGVLVTVTSSALQGQRTSVTGETGEAIVRNLPPGTYTVTFELEGMASVQSSADVQLGQTTPVNVTMKVQEQEETIIVTGELPSVLASSEVSTTYDFEEVNNLAIGRTPASIASLAPGLTTNTPNGGQVTISGGFAYDNVFLIDGVDANDNLFGTSSPVYIEDAIADLQVLTSGISAEYGRFSGGVVNVITKSGGNEFSGTLRADLTNDDWRELTPLEEATTPVTVLPDDISEVFSATLGGYVLKDKIWFFAAARDESVSSQGTFAQTSLPNPTVTEEERLELKATFNIADKHQIQGTYTDREQTGLRSSFSFSSTPNTLRTRVDPSDLQVARYSGVLTSSLFAELQYSEKTFTFQSQHGLDADTTPGTANFIENSPFFTFGFTGAGFSAHYNAPYFDGKDPEDRNNEQLAASLSYFLDSASAGSHDLKFGFEDFTSLRTGGNSQSPTDWVMAADVARVGGVAGGPVLINPDNTLTPVWRPFSSGAWQFLPNRNAAVETQTQSFYVNDRWQLNDNWSFNLGFRYEDVSGASQAGTVTVDTDAFVPRLAMSYDVRGDGKYRFDATYAQYAGKYSESQFAANTDVGNPPALLFFYTGAPGVGKNFAPAYDFFNPNVYTIVSACDGTQNVFVDSDINSPVVDEFTISAGMELKRGGFLKAIYTDREYNDFVEDFVTPQTGSTVVSVQGNIAGTFSNSFITNSDIPTREYQALQLIGRYRLSDNWTLDGNYTHQIKNDGNFEGEGTNTPGSSTVIGNYPEIRSFFQHSPIGALNDFAEHKLRVWTNYSLGLGRAGNLNFGLLANLDSGLSFSSTDSWSITPTQAALITAAGYVDSPTSQTLFFGTRGDVQFDDSLTFDLSINYQIPIWSDLELWIKADMLNVFDDDTQIAGNSTVCGAGICSGGDTGGGARDGLGLPVTFTLPANFKTARNNADFVDPQEYRFTVGFRF